MDSVTNAMLTAYGMPCGQRDECHIDSVGDAMLTNIKIKTHLRNNSKLVFPKVELCPRPYLIST